MPANEQRVSDAQVEAALTAFRAEGNFASGTQFERESMRAALEAALTDAAPRMGEADALAAALRDIHDFAHDHSTGPEVPDALWDIRGMAAAALTIATPAAPRGGEDDAAREPAPPHNLPTWSMSERIVSNYDFHQRAIAGKEGPQLVTIDEPREPTALERFIYEYDDADKYKSAWFMHRLQLVIDELTPHPDTAPAGVRGYFATRLESLRAELAANGGVAMSPQWHEKEAAGWRVRTSRQIAAYEAALAALPVSSNPSLSSESVSSDLPDGREDGVVVPREPTLDMFRAFSTWILEPGETISDDYLAANMDDFARGYRDMLAATRQPAQGGG